MRVVIIELCWLRIGQSDDGGLFCRWRRLKPKKRYRYSLLRDVNASEEGVNHTELQPKGWTSFSLSLKCPRVITCQALFAGQPLVRLQSIVPHHLSTLFSVYRVNTSLYFSLCHSHNQPFTSSLSVPILGQLPLFLVAASPVPNRLPIPNISLVRSPADMQHMSPLPQFRMFSADCCLMTCRAVANLTFISVVTASCYYRSKELNLSTWPIIVLPAIVLTWSSSLFASIKMPAVNLLQSWTSMKACRCLT